MQPTTTCHGERLHELVAGPFFVSETIHRSGLVLPRHVHATSCFHSVLDGEYAEETPRRTVFAGPGDSLFKPPRLAHWNRFGRSGSRTLRIEFRPHRFGLPVSSCPETLVSTRNPAVFDLSRRILREVRVPDAVTPMVVEGLCLELIALLLRVQRRAAGLRPDLRRRVQECAEFLRANFHASFTLTDLARRLEVNRTQLAGAFRQGLGMTMGEYLRRTRVEFVKQQLDSTDDPLAEIARAAGFADQSHCTRIFRRLAGMTPAAWRAGRSRRQASKS